VLSKRRLRISTVPGYEFRVPNRMMDDPLPGNNFWSLEIGPAI